MIIYSLSGLENSLLVYFALELLIQAYIPSLYSSLGIYIPLIVVNCMILGRVESFASKNDCISSFGDGLGMGIGFTMAICLISIFRE